jgi:glycolate oxidase iron-sulfur subunit
MEGLFTRVNRATARVLEANGCSVDMPADQGCCGALHAHAGDLEGARVLARRNIEAFEHESDSAIVTNAGGCGAMLVSYEHLLEHDPDYADRARNFSRRVRDISQQLAETGIREGAAITDQTVTYDASCHLIYGQHAGEAPIAMLKAIPGLNLVPLEGCEMCCGGAGVYNLMEPELSSMVLGDKLSNIKRTGAAVLATGNPGCHMQIGAGARLSGLSLEMYHPVELLDESYKRAGFVEDES